ncbi:MAG: hypothetical protein MJ210_02715 [Alphaproteobacteria bacterium]|nr:hypothetical protein [Alphaproteobacteria bacterium]
MSKITRLLILTFSFLGLFWFCLQPITDIGASKEYMQKPLPEEKLTVKELQDFLVLWSQVMQGSMKDSIGQMSLKTEGKYPKDVEQWLKSKKWSAERFFYDEQKIRELLEYVNLRINLKSNIALNKQNGVNLQSIINSQQKRMDKCPYSEDELALIEVNRYPVMQIFSGGAVLDKGDR